MELKNVSIDLGAYGLSAVAFSLQPILYPLVWVMLIVVSKTMFSHEHRRACDYLRGLVIGGPIGLLACLVAMEHTVGEYTSIAVGGLVAIVAEQIFRGDWFVKIMDTIVSIIKSRFSGKQGE